MIKIKRAECPPPLLSQGRQTQTGRKRPQKQYRKRNVVKKLWEMQRRKCCYCEAYIPEKGHSQAVEHFRPQSVYPNLRNDWPNLLLACAQCNGKKSDKFPTKLADGTKVIRNKSGGSAGPLLIDPSDYRIDPEDHLDFAVDIKIEFKILGLMRPKNNSRKGAVTIRTAGLHDPFHTSKHKTRIRELYFDFLMMDEANDQGDQSRLDRLREKFRGKLSAGCDLAAVARAFARVYSIETQFGIKIPNGWNTA